MDANLIYVKTAAGEEAVRQRTRVVQRNTRMVLILIDGNSTVAELFQKTGNEQLVEQALQDLERDGLIEPKMEQDSVWEQSRQLAAEIKAAAMNRLARELPKREPIIAPQATEAISAPVPFSVMSQSVAPFSTFGAAPQSMAAFSTFGGPPSLAPSPTVVTPTPVEEKKRDGLIERLISRRAKFAEDPIRSIQRGPRKSPLSLTASIALGVLGCVALAFLVFMLYPYDSHRQEIETTLSRLLGQPVQVAKVRAELTPKPGIFLGNVRGKDVQAAHVRLVPELFSLLGSRPVFSQVEVDGGVVSANGLAVLPKAVGAALTDDPALRARSIRFENLTVEVLGVSVQGLQAEIRPDDSGGFGPLRLITIDRSFRASVKQQGGGFVAEVEALSWQPALESRFRFDSLQGQFEWNGQQLAVRALDARIFDGAILGTLVLDRQSGQPSLGADLTVKHMSLQRLVEGLGHGRQYEGELAASLKVVGRGADWTALFPALSGEGSFTLNRAVLGGFDVVEAVRRGKSPVRGGTTRFEQVSGALRVTPGALSFSELMMTSGLLRAVGKVELSYDRNWSGMLDVEMRGSANLVRMPLSVSGTLKDPVLQGGR